MDCQRSGRRSARDPFARKILVCILEDDGVLAEADRKNLAALKNLPIYLGEAGYVPLEQIAKISYDAEYPTNDFEYPSQRTVGSRRWSAPPHVHVGGQTQRMAPSTT